MQDFRRVWFNAFTLARVPAGWNHPAEKDSRQINMLEHVPTAKPLHTLAGHALIISVMALTITATNTFADIKSGLIEGEYRIDSENCRVGQSKPDCRIYFEFRGSVARKLYEAMKSEGVADLCTGGQVKTNADGLRCFELGAGEYVCDVGYNFATEKLVSGDITC